MKITCKKPFSKGWLTGLVLGVASSVALLVYATTFSLPHTFSPGDTIRATEVNENFQALADKTAPAIVVKDRDGNTVGTAFYDGDAGGSYAVERVGHLIVTKSDINAPSPEIYFKSFDCTGQAYGYIFNQRMDFGFPSVTTSPSSGERPLYVPVPGAVGEVFTAQSHFSSGCVQTPVAVGSDAMFVPVELVHPDLFSIFPPPYHLEANI